VKQDQGPKFVRYINPVLAALRDLGGSARPREVVARVAEMLKISDSERSEPLASGTARFDNMVAWARFYLAKSGYIDSSRRGVWALTERGRVTESLSAEEAMDLFRGLHGEFSRKYYEKRDQEAEAHAQQKDKAGDEAEAAPSATPTAEDVEPAPDDDGDENTTGYREEVLEVLRTMPPAAFERFCKRLLRESGFQDVRVTGGSGDEGIDGIGILQVNSFVSFKVLFQCKRYRKSVTAGHVRDFRGAMMGRADKGIILTTGTFTADAQREAVRDGVPAIELVEGNRVVSMLEEFSLGLKPVRTFRVEHDFFASFHVDVNRQDALSPPNPRAQRNGRAKRT
jgi:restriction system protein